MSKGTSSLGMEAAATSRAPWVICSKDGVLAMGFTSPRNVVSLQALCKGMVKRREMRCNDNSNNKVSSSLQ